MPPITEAVKHLLIINIIIFFATATLPIGPEISQFMAWHYPTSMLHKPWQVVTHMFAHGSLNHLMFNMLSLFFIGPMMEATLGMKKFISYYFICGFGGVLLHLAFQFYQIQYLGNDYLTDIGMVGASGAINGLFIGLAYLFPNVEMMLMFIPIPIKAKYLAIAFIAIDLFSGVSGYGSGIAHFAHLGGALFGFLMLLYWRKYR